MTKIAVALAGRQGVGPFSAMRILKLIIGLIGAVMTAGGALWAQELNETVKNELNTLIQLQRELLGRASAAELPEQVEALRPRLQSLVFDYERFLRENPKVAEGFVSYSMLLGNPLIDERERAKALLLKANHMDANLPIVKNQLGKYLAEDGKPLDAVNYFLAAVELAPNEPLYHFQLGQLLGAARDDFLRSGEWTVQQIDEAMMTAFAEAVRLAPENVPYAYRQAEAYYDLQIPSWDDALTKWDALSARVESEAEKQMMRLHQINILLFQDRLDAAEALLALEVVEPLAGQKLKLVERLERLRNPDLVEGGLDASLANGGARQPTGEGNLPPVIPTFKAGEMADAAMISSAAIVAWAEETPLAPAVDWDASIAEMPASDESPNPADSSENETPSPKPDHNPQE